MEAKVYVEIGDNLKEAMLALIEKTHPDHVSGALKTAFGLNLEQISRAQIEAEVELRRLFLSQENVTWLP